LPAGTSRGVGGFAWAHMRVNPEMNLGHARAFHLPYPCAKARTPFLQQQLNA